MKKKLTVEERVRVYTDLLIAGKVWPNLIRALEA